MEDPVGTRRRKRRFHGGGIGDVPGESMDLVAERREPPRIVVLAEEEVDFVAVGQQPAGEIRTDEPAAARDQDALHRTAGRRAMRKRFPSGSHMLTRAIAATARAGT